MMTNDDERGEGVKNAQNLMTSYVNDPLFMIDFRIDFRLLKSLLYWG